MTISTQQNPLLHFPGKQLRIVLTNDFIREYVVFVGHSFRMVMKDKSIYRQVFKTAVQTFISEIKNNKRLSSLSAFVISLMVLPCSGSSTTTTNIGKVVRTSTGIRKIKNRQVRPASIAPSMSRKILRIFVHARFLQTPSRYAELSYSVFNSMFRHTKFFCYLVARLTERNVLLVQKFFSKHNKIIVPYASQDSNSLITSIV